MTTLYFILYIIAAVCFALAWAIAVAIRPMNALVVAPLVTLALYRFPHLAAHALNEGGTVGCAGEIAGVGRSELCCDERLRGLNGDE